MVWLLSTLNQMTENVCFQSSAMQTACPVWGDQITVRSARTQKPSFILAGVCLSVQLGSSPTATSVQVGVCFRQMWALLEEMFENEGVLADVCGFHLSLI